jgi:hypothetical protein
LRAKAVDTVATDDVLAVLKPIWTTKAETASRVRGRIERSWTRPRLRASAKAKTALDGAAIWTTFCRGPRNSREVIMPRCHTTTWLPSLQSFGSEKH